jgi:hypothetical protein
MIHKCNELITFNEKYFPPKKITFPEMANAFSADDIQQLLHAEG